MKKRVLAVVSGFVVLTGGEVGLFLWLNEPEIAKSRAEAFLRQKAYASAVELYQRALSRQPARPDLLLAFARALAGSGRLAEARLTVGQALALAPGHIEARQFALELAWQANDLPAAIDAARALAASPEDPRVQLGLADLLAGSGRFAEAAHLYERYLAERPDDQRARLQLAETLSASKAFDRAAAAYRVVLERSPEDADARIKLARALSWSKRYDESIKEYRRVLGE
jgi:tetratricopeptide (TPR) repeat protein